MTSTAERTKFLGDFHNAVDEFIDNSYTRVLIIS
ncbi:hypothetical protein LCGC14_2142530, partial [marine sediment metagenome]